MAKIVCKTCGTVIREDVDPDSVDAADLSHDHDDDPTRVPDERDDRDPPSASGGGDDADDDAPSTDDADPADSTDESGEDGDESDDDDSPDVTDERSDDGGERPGTADSGPEGHRPSGDSGGPDSAVDHSADVPSEIADMDQQDRDREAASWYEVDPDGSYDEVGDDFKRRYDRIRQQVNRERSEIGKRMSTRDEWSDGDHLYFRAKSDFLRDRQEWRDLRDEVADAFRDLKSRETRVPSRKGDGLNMDAVVQRVSGDASQDRLFTRKRQTAKGDRLLGVSVDMSGSMYGRYAKTAVAAICKAADIIGDDYLVNCWKAKGDAAYGKNVDNGCIGVMVGPGESFKWESLDAFETGGGTNTADGMYDMYDLMGDETAREKVMIVITDGGANNKLSPEYGRSTGDAGDDAARVARMARQDGMKVIGLGVGSISDEDLAEQFGPNGYVTGDMDNLAEKLVEVYRDQINV